MKFLILLFPLFDGNFYDNILPHGLRLCKSFSVRMQKNIYILAAQSALCNFLIVQAGVCCGKSISECDCRKSVSAVIR
jgi:hypothetical protein